MIWWLKIRAVPALAAGTAATIAVGLLVGTAQLPVPTLTGQAGQFLVGHLITLMPAVLVLFGTGRGDAPAESVASRPVRLWDVSLGAAVALAALVTAWLCHLIWPAGNAPVLGRNIAGYIGLALILLPLTGHRAAGALIAVAPLLCAGAGWAEGGRPEPWAWILHPGDSALALALALATLITGIIVTLTRRKPPWDISAVQ
ncbi:hypothetical protein [Streptomyces sp. NPDC020141]|uniref:hypothetical protein n=1 Tax=Streptomyces sp. NPDC020141 TaxID=3365065 RepID=UPI00378A8507